MRKTEQFRHQHAGIMEVVITISDQLNEATVLDRIPDILGQMINLSGRLKAHLAAEDNLLYPMMIAADHPLASDRAAEYQEEMEGLAASFESYMSKWRSFTAIEADPGGFIAETRELFDALSDRIDRENHRLYPLADQL